MPTGQNYVSTAPQTNLVGGINNTQVNNITVASFTGFPATPFTMVFDIGTASQEAIDVLAVSGNTVTNSTRGVDGTSSQAHGNNATVTHSAIGRDFREARAHIDASVSNDSTGHSVHGLTGGSSVVGTTDTQTLSNKTLTTPVINGSGGMLTLPAGPATLVDTASSQTLTDKILTAPSITNPTITSGGAVTGGWTVDDLSVSGLTGATTASRYVGATAGGPPSTGTFSAGDMVVDTKWGINWICVTAGTPGTWQGSGPALLQKIKRQTTGNFNFTSIPAYFSSLRILVSAQSTTPGGAPDDGIIQFNGDTGSNYWSGGVSGNQTTPGPTTLTPAAAAHGLAGSYIAASSQGQTVIDIANYSATNFNKMWTSKGFTGTAIASPNNWKFVEYSGIWTNTAAITSVLLDVSGSGSFATNSTAWLYAIP